MPKSRPEVLLLILKTDLELLHIHSRMISQKSQHLIIQIRNQRNH